MLRDNVASAARLPIKSITSVTSSILAGRTSPGETQGLGGLRGFVRVEVGGEAAFTHSSFSGHRGSRQYSLLRKRQRLRLPVQGKMGQSTTPRHHAVCRTVIFAQPQAGRHATPALPNPGRRRRQRRSSQPKRLLSLNYYEYGREVDGFAQQFRQYRASPRR